VEQSLGCNRLLRLYPGEVRAIATVEELLEDLGLAEAAGSPAEPDGAPERASGSDACRPARRGRPEPTLAGASAILASLPPPERTVAAALLVRPPTLDELVAATGMAPASVLVVLTRLEERGLVSPALGRYLPAGALAAAPLVLRDGRGSP
jgi:predicted Rossmann fold nucleotide-binding protein DprA/Smf involved in DNA uptake